MKILKITSMLLCLAASLQAASKDTFTTKIKPFLDKYCVECHGGKKVKGHVNFNTISNMESAYKKIELRGEIIDLMKDQDMPPKDEKQPTAAEVKMYTQWYTDNFINIKPRPGVGRMRRLSTEEYRNSLRSLLGFDMQINASGTAETKME
ncbi:MAG: c-type cytochrome, partial [Lentisphaeraceae bacterium]|nr:c-type cytochrome [Lentisphaeraceae bacterium]